MPGSKGALARQRLLDAARAVFRRDGFVEANVDSIVAEAGTSRGTFYTYFESKTDIFRALALEVDALVTHQVTRLALDVLGDPVTNLDRANRRYLDVVAANADVYALVEQVGSVDVSVRKGRLHSRRAHVERVAATIRNWQASGVADPTVDPVTTAAALVSMLSSSAYWMYAGGDTYDREQPAVTLTDIWVRAVGVRREPDPEWTTYSH